METELELNAQVRKSTGNKLKTLREKGFLPAVVYGPGHKSVSIQLDYQEFRKVFEEAGESTIIKLKVKSSPAFAKREKSKVDEKNVLIHDVDRDPVADKFIHVDFLQVRMDKVISAEVSLVFEGESSAVKNLDGVLVKNITKVEVEALPKDLPHEIKVDISALETFDDRIKIGDLKLSEGVKIKIDSGEVVASVIPPRTQEELEELEEKPEGVVEEVEEVGEEAEAEVEGEVKEVEPSEEEKQSEAKSSEASIKRGKPE